METELRRVGVFRVSKPNIAPGPRGHPLIGSLLEFRRDVLGLLRNGHARYGDVFRCRLGPEVIHLVARPEYIDHVLLTNQHNYNKDTRSSSKISSITDVGLLTSNGAHWLRQRRLMQPVFQPRHLGRFIDIMISTTSAMLERWREVAQRGEALDVESAMMRLTCTIVGKALFGTDVSSDIDTIADSATVLMERAWSRLERIVDAPTSWPTPQNLRFHRASRRLDEIVWRIIHERRQSGQKSEDLLTLLLWRKDGETGAVMSDQEVRNETVTLLLAGHETTANSLAWTWYCLSRFPEIAQRVRAEVAAVVGGRAPKLDDLPRLEYTTRVYREALRLYPPIWIMERRVLAADTIAGYHIPAGSSVVISPYVTHRHREFWDHPDEFDPDRFLPERTAGRPARAYLPFGAGQRQCIGKDFAMMEAVVILAMITQRYRLDLVPGQRVELNPGITLRTKHGLLMTLHPCGERI
jgi:cytochrome P450